MPNETLRSVLVPSIVLKDHKSFKVSIFRAAHSIDFKGSSSKREVRVNPVRVEAEDSMCQEGFSQEIDVRIAEDDSLSFGKSVHEDLSVQDHVQRVLNVNVHKVEACSNDPYYDLCVFNQQFFLIRHF